MAAYSIVIKDGSVIDGTGRPRFTADLAIRDGRIAEIGTVEGEHADRVIDAGGRIVAPGVIDPHTHYDAQIHWDPYCTTSSWHGVTSVAVGNCGFGFAPCPPELRERYMQMMVNTEQIPYAAMREALPWNWVTYPEWVERLRRKPKGINLASYLPLNSLMMLVMGVVAAKSRPATASERARMRELLHQAMDHGAIGFGFSYLQRMNSHVDFDGTPMPTDTMAVEEAYNLADVLRERGEGVIQALCELPVVQNRQVAEELARRSGRPVLHNVIAAFDTMPEYHRSILRWLDETAAAGLEIYSQSLCFRAWVELRLLDYNAWDQILELREFSTCKGVGAKLAKAADREWRARVKAVYTPEVMNGAGGTFETFVLNDAHGAPGYDRFEGRSLGEIATELGVHVVDLVFDLGIATELTADFRSTDAVSKDPEKVHEMLRHPRVLAGTSDGGAHGKFYSGGHFSTDLLTWMVREEGRMSLEEMHHKLSALPARALGLHKRGELREGYAADVMVYDYERIGYVRDRYQIAHDLPGGDWRRVVPARGVSWVLVNGEPIFRDNNCQGITPGRLLGNRGEAMDRRLALAS